MHVETESKAHSAATQRLGVPPTASSAKSARIPALDFTKGALVLIMVLYHWINYFIGNQWGYYRYLRFLTPSFIFIAGFMISNVYLSKYAAADPRLSKRLLIRGIKLMAVFLVLNLFRILVIPAVGHWHVREKHARPAKHFHSVRIREFPDHGRKARVLLHPCAH